MSTVFFSAFQVSVQRCRYTLHYEFVPVFLLWRVQHGGEYRIYMCLVESIGYLTRLLQRKRRIGYPYRSCRTSVPLFRGEGDDQLWGSGRGAIAGCHCGVPICVSYLLSKFRATIHRDTQENNNDCSLHWRQSKVDQRHRSILHHKRRHRCFRHHQRRTQRQTPKFQLWFCMALYQVNMK